MEEIILQKDIRYKGPAIAADILVNEIKVGSIFPRFNDSIWSGYWIDIKDRNKYPDARIFGKAIQTMNEQCLDKIKLHRFI